MTQPLVSISCITYNHEKYIRETIEGFLMQKTTFSIEILIHDDASTDKTAEIIKEYELKYPNLIKPIYQLENQYSKGVSISLTFNFPRAKGKYIALCEGDDFWADPYKLQKQVSFLEDNPEYGLAHGNCNLYYQDSGKIVKNANDKFLNLEPIKNKNDLFFKIIKWEYIIRTATVVFRKDLLNQVPKNSMRFQMGDTPMWLDFTQITKFVYFKDVFSMYRILPNSASNNQNPIKQYRFILSMYEMRIYYLKKYCHPTYKNIEKPYNNSLINYLAFDPNFRPNFSMLSPSIMQKIKFKLLKYSICRKLFKYQLKVTDKSKSLELLT